MYNLQYIRIPQILLPDYTQMTIQLQTLILTECRDLNFDFVHKYENLQNNGEILRNLIKSIYTNNQTMESLQLMCPGVNQTKLRTFEKQFNSNRIDYLSANYDEKCLTIQRSKDFYN